MRAIIIGSKGFIGKHLTNFLEEQGYDVWKADVIVDYSESDKYFLIDASNSDFAYVFQKSKYDICINSSGAASVQDSIKNPIRDYYLNTVNVFKILESIRRFQPECKFMNLSSAAVYGNPDYLPVNEKSKADPLSPYGIHKLQAEQICKEFYDYYGIRTCSLRIFSAYGEGLNKQLFWDLYKKVKKREYFSLYGTGLESRDFIYIDDLVQAIEVVIKFLDFRSDLINVANGQETMIKDAVSLFVRNFENKVRYSFSGESRKGDPTNWMADINKLNLLGYQPQIDLQTGLERYVKWLVDNNL